MILHMPYQQMPSCMWLTKHCHSSENDWFHITKTQHLSSFIWWTTHGYPGFNFWTPWNGMDMTPKKTKTLSLSLSKFGLSISWGSNHDVFRWQVHMVTLLVIAGLGNIVELPILGDVWHVLVVTSDVQILGVILGLSNGS